ncbi:hypothetical protein H3V53_40410 [Paraburkholderia bengalensis]|uniref:Type VI secretion protein n=2 Tax=Paraburkholderia bengalensis TaxID=2747562 RepID=A0ABU8J5G6_9BURK
MSWPIPTLTPISYPKPLDLRVWLPGLVALALGTAGAVLLLWPHGKSTQGVQFWALLIGVPLVSCTLALGIRLNRWEREQTIVEEAEREQRRIMSLWRAWSRRDVRVTAALAVLPVPVPPAQLGVVGADLPVNRGRAKGFAWSNGKAETWRRTKLLGLIASGLHATLAARQEMSVRLLLDEASMASVDAWKEDARNALGKIAPRCKFGIDAEPAVGCAPFLAQQVDLVGAAPQLVIAAQMWPDGKTEHAFSEGAAALLVERSDAHAGQVFRPMTSTTATLDADLKQLVQIQIAPDRITHAWLTGCTDESAGITSSLTSDPKTPLIERPFDDIVGEPGPASSWIALATALEALETGGPQLIAWREKDSEPLHLCMVGPAQPDASQKEL